MVEVAEDNKKKEKKGEKEKEMQKRRRKSPYVGIEPTTSYSALPLNNVYVFNCTYYLSQISFLMMRLWLCSLTFMSQLGS